MEKQFNIIFDFPVAHSTADISLGAIVELHHSEPFYRVHDFYYKGVTDSKDQLSILPAQEIQLVRKGKYQVWVHRDSSRESLLSIAMGKAIEKVLSGKVDIANNNAS